MSRLIDDLRELFCGGTKHTMEQMLTPLPPHALDDLHDTHDLNLDAGALHAGSAGGEAAQQRLNALPLPTEGLDGHIDDHHFLDILSGGGNHHGDLPEPKPLAVQDVHNLPKEANGAAQQEVRDRSGTFAL